MVAMIGRNRRNTDFLTSGKKRHFDTETNFGTKFYKNSMKIAIPQQLAQQLVDQNSEAMRARLQ